MLDNINLNSIIQILGTPLRTIGNEYIWQCPYCKDKSKNNMMYNPKKGILYCFANQNHSKLLLKEIWQRVKIKKTFSKQQPIKNILENNKNTKPQLSPVKLEEFKKYQYKCNQELLSCKKSLKDLLFLRGINSNTVKECLIGIDKKKHRFVFPSVRFGGKNEVIGFEYRALDLSKRGLYREKNSLSSIVEINQKSNETANLIILEGYLDCYLFYQHLKRLRQENFYHIATPSNGVAGFLKHFDDIHSQLNTYDKIYLFLDSDDAGQKTMQEVKAKYPQVKSFNMDCGCKDFNEHYLKCLQQGKRPPGNP